MEDALMIDIPQFIPEYKENVKYGYSTNDTKYKKNLKELLYKTSKGYCMYCYSKILVDKKEYGHIEHGIEKAADTENDTSLEKCVLNLAIACPVCNDKFKKRGEKERIEYIKTLKEYKKIQEKRCNPLDCHSMCEELINLRKKLLTKKEGHILLQPLSQNYSINICENSSNGLSIQYDLLRGEFIPNRASIDLVEESSIIKDHINLFHLNDIKYQTNEVYRFCKDYINGEVSFTTGHYDNYLVDIFIQQMQGLSDTNIQKICELIYLRGVILERI